MAVARKRRAGTTSYRSLLALSEADLVEASQPSPCGLCAKTCPRPVVLKNCIHTFCRECLTAWITGTGNDWGQCPYRDDRYSCLSYLEEKEIRALVSADEYEKLVEKSVAAAEVVVEKMYHCMIGGCEGRSAVAAGADSFICPLCHASNCLTCLDVHPAGVCGRRPMESVPLKKIVHPAGVCGRRPLESVSSKKEVPVKRRRGGDYKKLLTLEKRKLVVSQEMVECPICMCETEPKQAIILKECLHSFCRACLVECISHCDGGSVRCPYMDSNYTCQASLQDREVKALAKKHVYERYLEKSVLLAEAKIKNSFHCKTINCVGWCEYDQGVELFKCPVCLHDNCLKCSAIHEGMSCAEYTQSSVNCQLNSSKIEAMLKKGEAMKCPSCKAVIMKDGGCDAVTCSVCRLEICWITKQARWGPKGFGDTSAGCKCKVGGKICHPKCRNCH